MNQTSVKYLSSLLDNPQSLTEGDRGSVASFVQSYPYFVPARYLSVLQEYRKGEYSPDILTSAKPYMGNWLVFWSFLQTGMGTAVPETEAKEYPVDQVSQVADEQETFEAVADAPPGSLVAEELMDSFAVVEEPPAIQEEPIDFPSMPEELPVADAAVFSPDENFETPGAQILEEVVLDETNRENAFTDVPAEKVVSSEPSASHEKAEEVLIVPVDTTDYFRQMGENISNEIPEDIADLAVAGSMDEVGGPDKDIDDEAKSLMVMMSFSEWLMHFKHVSEKEREETSEQKALRTMWQKEKLAAALEEENEEIPENVFEMAVNSIAKEDGLASETLAEIYIKQAKYDKAIDMYRKLSLRNPQKSTYFARKIEEILKDKQS